jgi:hypothetical protein
VVENLKLGVKAKRAEVGGLPEVVGFREDDVMFGEGELHIVLADGKDVAETRALQLLEEGLVAGKDLLKKVERTVRHGRLVFNNIRQNIRLR